MDVLRYFTWNPYMTNSRVTSNVAAGQGDRPSPAVAAEAGRAGSSGAASGRFCGARCLVGGGLAHLGIFNGGGAGRGRPLTSFRAAPGVRDRRCPCAS